MAKVYKKYHKTLQKNVWYLDYFDEHNERVRMATGFTSKKMAEELLHKKLQEAATARHFPERVIKKISFEDFVNTKYLPLHAKNKKHYRDYEEKCKVFVDILGKFNLTEVPVEEMMTLLNSIKEGRANNTYNNYRNVLSGIYTFAIKIGYADDNPVRHIKLLIAVARERILSHEEQDKLLAAASDPKRPSYLHRMIQFDLRTGLRDSELKDLQWTCINLEQRVMSIVGKKDKLRHINLDNVAMRILDIQRQASNGSSYVFPYGKDGGKVRRLTRSFNTAVRLAGIAHTVIHDLRRTAGANWIVRNINVRQVQAWLGHEDIKTTIKHYGHLFDGSGKHEIKKMDE